MRRERIAANLSLHLPPGRVTKLAFVEARAYVSKSPSDVGEMHTRQNLRTQRNRQSENGTVQLGRR